MRHSRLPASNAPTADDCQTLIQARSTAPVDKPFRSSYGCDSCPPRDTPPLGQRATSPMGQKRRFDPQPLTSGLPQSTDIARPARLVRFVPQADPTTRLASLGILAGLESRIALSMI